MVTKTVPVRTTVDGEAKEKIIDVSLPESVKEAREEWGKDNEGNEKLLVLACRMFTLDKTNAERVVLRGGEAKVARKEANDLAKQLLANPELLAKIKRQIG